MAKNRHFDESGVIREGSEKSVCGMLRRLLEGFVCALQDSREISFVLLSSNPQYLYYIHQNDKSFTLYIAEAHASTIALLKIFTLELNLD